MGGVRIVGNPHVIELSECLKNCVEKYYEGDIELKLKLFNITGIMRSRLGAVLLRDWWMVIGYVLHSRRLGLV